MPRKYSQRIAKLRNDILAYRLRMVRAAQTDGIYRTAKAFSASHHTVKKWVLRYQEQGRAGLVDIPSVAKSNPNAMPLYVQHALCKLKLAAPHVGSRRFFKTHGIAPLCSRQNLDKVWKRHGLFDGRKKRRG